MTQHTTGEVAKLCGVTVRTVQFYDSKGLLVPSGLTDGGRRLYSDSDIRRMQAICFLKELGFSLSDISALLSEDGSDIALRFLLSDRRRKLEERIEGDRAALAKLQDLESGLSHFKSLTPESFGLMADFMEGKRKLRNMRIAMLLVGLCMDAAWMAPLVVGIVTGLWWPFALGAAVAIVLGIAITRHYLTHTAYVCPNDSTVFRPALKSALFSMRTPSMRKLTCPVCGYSGYCLEIVAPKGASKHVGGCLVWENAES